MDHKVLDDKELSENARTKCTNKMGTSLFHSNSINSCYAHSATTFYSMLLDTSAKIVAILVTKNAMRRLSPNAFPSLTQECVSILLWRYRHQLFLFL